MSDATTPANLPTSMDVSCCPFKSCGLTDVYLVRNDDGELAYLRGSNDEPYAVDNADGLRRRIEAGDFWSVTNVEVSDTFVRCDAYVSTNSTATFIGGEMVDHTETAVDGDEDDKRKIVDAFVTALGVVRGRTYRFESLGRVSVRDGDWDNEMYRFTYAATDVKTLGPEITSKMGRKLLSGNKEN